MANHPYVGFRNAEETGDIRACLLVIKSQDDYGVAWIVLGLVAGFIGSKIVNKRGEGLLLDIVLGIVGAIVGGWLAGFVGLAGVSGLNLYSLLIAVVGAVVVLLVYHAIRRMA